MAFRKQGEYGARKFIKPWRTGDKVSTACNTDLIWSLCV
jgi:hypothetical protein